MADWRRPLADVRPQRPPCMRKSHRGGRGAACRALRLGGSRDPLTNHGELTCAHATACLPPSRPWAGEGQCGLTGWSMNAFGVLNQGPRQGAVGDVQSSSWLHAESCDSASINARSTHAHTHSPFLVCSHDRLILLPSPTAHQELRFLDLPVRVRA